jgi:hypothetical protein
MVVYQPGDHPNPTQEGGKASAWDLGVLRSARLRDHLPEEYNGRTDQQF